MASKKSWKGKTKRNEPAPAKPPDLSELIGTTNLTNKDVELYLVKMPAYLAQQFEDPSRGIVGRLRFPDASEQNGDSGPALPKVILDKKAANSSSDSGVGAGVTEFDLEYLSTKPNMMVFSGSRGGEEDDMRIEGKVLHQCVAKPKMDSNYRNVAKTRTTIANTHDRFLLRMDDKERLAAEREALKPMSMAETTKQREERKKQKEDARRHLDVPDEKWREYTKVAVFKAFDIQSHYTADELAKVIGEPTARIRPIISEVCAYNKSGPFASRYELKDEFKTVSQRKQKERDLEDHRLAQIDLVRKRREEQTEKEMDSIPPAKRAKPS